MINFRSLSRTGSVTLVALSAACGGSHTSAVQSGPAPAAYQQGLAGAIARAQADSLRHPYTEADIHFMSGMIGHHAQAIVMSRMAATHGASENVQTLASRIINAQQDEIVIMQRWLRNRRLPVPDPSAGPMKMTMNGMEHEMLMPGMLTSAQMQDLDQSRGEAFDKLFLTGMIQHHNGAVSMVKDLFGSYGAGQDETVFKFASDVNVDQTTEIARMQRMLATLTIFGPS